VFALATTGCATKKYVREQAGTVNQRVSDVEKKTADEIAGLGEKTQKDISRVEERAMTADNKAAEAARAAQQADEKAGQANQLAQNAKQIAETNQSQLGEVSKNLKTLETANNYKLAGTEEVLFGFDRSTLTEETKAKLNQVAQQATGLNRVILEVEGFTDSTGPRDYNLALSRRRADAVVRYLVTQNIPLRSIHMLGLGVAEPGTITQTSADGRQAAPEGQQMSRREMRKQARRVVIRIYAPETSLSASSMTSPQTQAAPAPQPQQNPR
jgi:outer membrane protein OmpA-like peptidoglycan-associated protein